MSLQAYKICIYNTLPWKYLCMYIILPILFRMVHVYLWKFMTFCACSKIQLLLPQTIMIWFANPTLLIQVALFKKATYFMNFLCWPPWGCLRPASGWVYSLYEYMVGKGKGRKNLFRMSFGMLNRHVFQSCSQVTTNCSHSALAQTNHEAMGWWNTWSFKRRGKIQVFPLCRSEPFTKSRSLECTFAASIINDTLRILLCCLGHALCSLKLV